MKIKYPKLMIFFIVVVFAYFFYIEAIVYAPLHDLLIRLSYLGAFLAGLLFSYGLTTPFSIAVFLFLGEGKNILLTAMIGGLGAFLSDYLIFKFLRKSFSDEIVELKHEKIIMYFNRKLPKPVRKYVALVIAAFILASPLPDELGVALLAMSMEVTTKTLFLFSFISNTIGIAVILGIGSLL